MCKYACAVAAVLSIRAVGMQAPPLSRIATFDGASLHIKGDSGQPVILQGYTNAHDAGKFSWDRLKDQLDRMDQSDEARSGTYEGLTADIMQDEVAASLLLNMHYAQKKRYNYVLFSYKNTGGALVPGACKHHGQSQPSHWCKAQALESAIELYKDSQFFMWLDADIIVRNMDIDFYHYLDSAHRCFDGQETSKVNVFTWINLHWDTDTKCNRFGAKGNSGALVFHKKADESGNLGMKYFLNEWWLRQNATHLSESDTHDQGAFNDAFKHYPAWAKVVFGEDNFMDVPRQFLVHRCKECHWMPETAALIRKVMAENKLDVDMLRDDVSKISGSVVNA